jgi:hypothetical protein
MKQCNKSKVYIGTKMKVRTETSFIMRQIFSMKSRWILILLRPMELGFQVDSQQIPRPFKSLQR